ncbi:MAG TPA: hypothetical protein RMF84_15815, partial [Polyangiaceae bacterium LLY-WYZ-14_1]|nr:hypothetical protein [Polyangiaceae bacterium LLY-WYZ-14_1]
TGWELKGAHAENECQDCHQPRRLFEIAEVLSEGGIRPGDDAYFGSTMLTVDLDDLAPGWREPLADGESRKRLLEVVAGSVRFRLRLLRLARREMSRRLQGAEAGTMVAETRFRLMGAMLHADVDLEAPLVVSSGWRHRQG